jgi:hypothetical protein
MPLSPILAPHRWSTMDLINAAIHARSILFNPFNDEPPNFIGTVPKYVSHFSSHLYFAYDAKRSAEEQLAC